MACKRAGATIIAARLVTKVAVRVVEVPLGGHGISSASTRSTACAIQISPDSSDSCLLAAVLPFATNYVLVLAVREVSDLNPIFFQHVRIDFD
jgi:hypothetical protein